MARQPKNTQEESPVKPRIENSHRWNTRRWRYDTPRIRKNSLLSVVDSARSL